jgi:hypothetical protein
MCLARAHTARVSSFLWSQGLDTQSKYCIDEQVQFQIFFFCACFIELLFSFLVSGFSKRVTRDSMLMPLLRALDPTRVRNFETIIFMKKVVRTVVCIILKSTELVFCTKIKMTEFSNY